MGEITGSLPGTLQGTVLAALVAFLQLCIKRPLLVPQLEVLAVLLPCDVLAVRLTGSGNTAALATESTSSAAFSASETSPADSTLHRQDPMDRPAEMGGEDRVPCSALRWLLAPGSRGSLLAVEGSIIELIHELYYTADHVLYPSTALYQCMNDKMLLGECRTAVVVGSRCPSSRPTCHCSPLQAASQMTATKLHQRL